MVAFRKELTVGMNPNDVRFSNRPFRVKRFQTIHDSGVNVARGLALLSGLGTKALPSWVSKTRWNNLSGDLAVNVTAGSSGRTNSPHPSSRVDHHSIARWRLCFLIGLPSEAFSFPYSTSFRSFRVKRFQTIHDSGVNVARGLALLSGLGTKALPSWVSKTRWNNLSGDLAVNVTAGSSGRTN